MCRVCIRHTHRVRIAIDATSVPARPAGAGVYAVELVRALAERAPVDGYALFTRGAWFDEALAGRRDWHIERVRASSRARRSFWEQTRLPRRLERLAIDVLHSTHHTLPLASVRCRRVVTVHDLTFFTLPGRYPPARRIYMQTATRLAARVADAIIVPSQSVRVQLERRLRPSARTVVVYEAPAARFRPVQQAQATRVARRYGVDGPYVLSVGTLEPGKNRARLLRAMRALRDEGLEHALVIAGQRGWRYEREIALIDALRMRDAVVLPGYVAEDDLPALYAGAAVFAFPSLCEGFGLPVLEAMACGTPVLTSNVSATAEVAGEAALLVDPRSQDEITAGLRRLLREDALWAEMRRRGLARAGEYSWRRAADETHAVYAQTLAAGGPA